MRQHARPRRMGQESAVRVDAVPSQQSGARGGDVGLDVGKQVAGGGFSGSGGSKTGGCQAGYAVGSCAPVVHGGEFGARSLDDGVEAGGVQGVEVSVGEQAGEGENGIGVRVEASHLLGGKGEDGSDC